MTRSRHNKTSLNYGSLENRCLLANSVFFLDAATSTLQIRASVTEVADAEFANDMTFSIDSDTNELVVTEEGCGEQRFNLTDVDRISYRGTAGNDRFTNNTDIDARIVGFGGDDFIVSGGGDDHVIGANGNDIIFTGNGDDYAAGNRGDDQLIEVEGATGNDRFFGGEGNDRLEGGNGADFLAGHEGNDTIQGGAANDVIFGHDGIDQLFGGSGGDFLYGGEGDDTLNGEFGNDRLLGQNGADVISGGEGNDVAFGGNGHDTLNGDAGDDRLVGNLGNDTLLGGIGADTHVAAAATSDGATSGFDTVITGDDTDVDVVTFHPGSDSVDEGAEDNVFDTEVIRRNLQTRFLTQNIRNEGWQQTSSGLQYRIVTPGTGATPVATDTVAVNYVGTFIDGTEFDANEDISFQLNRVITGWTEGLQLVSVGGTIELAIPASLGYGVNGIAGIPGGTTLLFTVDLLDINPQAV